jgi:hypothetical protein
MRVFFGLTVTLVKLDAFAPTPSQSGSKLVNAYGAAIEGKEQPDGSLLVRILIFNPDWDEPLQIASIQSRPDDADCSTSLGCNLNHVSL